MSSTLNASVSQFPTTFFLFNLHVLNVKCLTFGMVHFKTISLVSFQGTFLKYLFGNITKIKHRAA